MGFEPSGPRAQLSRHAYEAVRGFVHTLRRRSCCSAGCVLLGEAFHGAGGQCGLGGLRFAALLFGEQLLAVWRADLTTPLSRFPIAKGCSHVNAALPFIHDDCAATGAAAMLTSHYLSGCEAVATGRGTIMAVKAGVIRAGARTTRRGAAETFTEGRLPGSGNHRRGAVAPWRFGRYLHAGGMHRVALPPSRADALLFVRRWSHLLQGREAASAQPGRYGQYPARYDALARRLARSLVLTSGAVGSRGAGSGHRLGHTRQRR